MDRIAIKHAGDRQTENSTYFMCMWVVQKCNALNNLPTVASPSLETDNSFYEELVLSFGKFHEMYELRLCESPFPAGIEAGLR